MARSNNHLCTEVKSEADWQCEHCTFSNSSKRSICQLCERTKYGNVPPENFVQPPAQRFSSHISAYPLNRELKISAGPGLFAVKTIECKSGLSWTSPRIRQFAMFLKKNNLDIATHDKKIYEQFYNFSFSSENKEKNFSNPPDNLDAKTIPSWKEIFPDNSLENFRKQTLLVFSLLTVDEIKKDPDLDPLYKHQIDFMNMCLESRILFEKIPNLTELETEANQAYCNYIYAVALHALRETFPDYELSSLIHDNFKLTKDNFKNALSKTYWGESLTSRFDQLFYLATDRDFLSLIEYLQIMRWLGDPSLTKEQAIPAPKAIDLFYEILTKNPTAVGSFRTFHSCEIKSSDPFIQLSNGGFFWDEKDKEKRFLRNLVLTDANNEITHRLLFTFNPSADIVIDSDQSCAPRFRCGNKKPFLRSGLYLDFRQSLTSFNLKKVTVADPLPVSNFNAITAAINYAGLKLGLPNITSVTQTKNHPSPDISS